MSARGCDCWFDQTGRYQKAFSCEGNEKISSTALENRISKYIADDRIIFNLEEGRVKNAMLKLARGHAAFELSQSCQHEPDHFWSGPLERLHKERQEAFMAVHIQELYGEIGSRNMQHMFPNNYEI